MTNEFYRICFGFEEESGSYFAYVKGMPGPSTCAMSKVSQEDAFKLLANQLADKLYKIKEAID